MYILIPTAAIEPYRQLRSLSFTPEVDLTLSSQPVNEFRAEIVTGDVIAVGGQALLYDDMDQLWADYIVTKSERIDRQTVRIVAQSGLALMDRWTLPAEMFQGVSVTQFVSWIFNATPKSGYIYNITVNVDSYYSGVTVTGFCPEQTARERLQWLCLTIGAVVRQCFTANMQIVPAPDVDATAYYAKGTLIPFSDTYMKPSITIRDLTRSVAVTGYENFTNVDPTPQPEEGVEPGTEPAQGLEWQSSVDDQGVTWWYNPVDWTYTNEETPEIPGQEVSIDGVKLINGEATRQVLGWLSAAYFRRGEIQMEVINNRQYYPGQKVRVYTEEDTIYSGYIQSCDFTFGVQAKARLTISSDLYQVPTGKLTIEYRYGDLPLGRTEMVLPDDEFYDIENPIISWYEGNRYVEYTPTTPRATGTENAVVQYVSRTPARIQIITPPNRLTYLDGTNIDFTGMLVRAYDNSDRPWTQNGLFSDGYIPLRYLTLPETKADIDKAEIRGKEEPELNIRPSIPPVISGTYCCRIIDPVAHHYRPDYRYKSEYRITGGLLTANAKQNEDGTFHGFFRYILAADSPEATIEYTETRVNGEIAEHTTFHPRYSYKYNGKTVYFSSGGETIAYDDIIYEGPWTAHVSPMSSGDPAGPTAWVMIYGPPTADGYETIPVRWKVPGTNQVFEDSFTILVTTDMNAPTRIELTSPPDKLKYNDGDTIDYTGMVVTLYDMNGQPSTIYEEFPGGIVPLDKITDMPTIAKIGQTEHIVGNINAHTILRFSVSFDIEIAPNPYPVHIEVTTPPTRTSYSDGETIDFAGMVVTGYDKDGNLWNGDGVVPLSALTLPQRTASVSNATVEQIVYDGKLLERGTKICYWYNEWWKGYIEDYENKYIGIRFETSDGVMAATNALIHYHNWDYQTKRVPFVFASRNNSYCEKTDIKGNGDELTYNFRIGSGNNQYTDESGRTFFWNNGSDLNDKDALQGGVNEITLDATTNEKRLESYGAYARAMLDGQPTGVYRQYIPVRYQIPGKDKPLEAFFAVTIGEVTP